MATRMLRRGLPRVPGGEPWPPADASVEVADSPLTAESGSASGFVAAEPVAAEPVAAEPVAAEPVAAAASVAAASVAVGAESVAASSAGGRSARADSHVRRGLPRVPGGEPWPPVDAVAGADGSAVVSETAPAAATAAPVTAAAAAAPTTGGTTETPTPSAAAPTAAPGRQAHRLRTPRPPRASVAACRASSGRALAARGHNSGRGRRADIGFF
ncbi:hypothetical protein [Microbacterium sp. Se63.02b]|uniref:hypothetical protein n=1 Tax=Microbacterium sp. Se63.02b TaxID=2709304 RepID=UPI001604C092|nr:hypothetical protein [Microbacterium sp. Se63.02b]QNA93703.1 hypothetical protein G4G29_17995 [Microbacterium sp. Se63.02b]